MRHQADESSHGDRMPPKNQGKGDKAEGGENPGGKFAGGKPQQQKKKDKGGAGK